MTRSFVTLGRSAQLSRLRQRALSFAARYQLSVTRLRLLQYEDNAVYRVGTPAGEYILRLSVQNGRSEREGCSETAWLRSLDRDPRLTVPRPAGPVLHEEVAGWPEPVTAALFDWISGRKLRGTPDTARRLGEVTALLHHNARSFQPDGEFERPRWGVPEIFDDGAALNHPLAAVRLTAQERALLQDVSVRLHERMPLPSHMDWGMTHADLHLGNLLKTDPGQVAVIDFDDCGWGYYALDIATALSSALRSMPLDAYSKFAESYLDGYRSVCDLPPAVIRFDEFLVMRDMIIVNFILGSSNDAVGSWGPLRVAGILELLRGYVRSGRYAGHLDCLST
jgi:Ser/Thr protein kinase RdoA (MazF antagonist)